MLVSAAPLLEKWVSRICIFDLTQSFYTRQPFLACIRITQTSFKCGVNSNTSVKKRTKQKKAAKATQYPLITKYEPQKETFVQQPHWKTPVSQHEAIIKSLLLTSHSCFYHYINRTIYCTIKSYQQSKYCNSFMCYKK